MRAQDAALFLTAAVLGGAASQWPVGRLSDRIGRRPMAMIVVLGRGTGRLGLWAGSTGSKSI